MKNSQIIFSLVVLLWTMFTASGCSERLARENVFANTETGLGIFVAENPKTQMYEGKIGYFRHELFFVPTSKTVTYNDVRSNGLMGKIFGTLLEADVKQNDPSLTPEVLADVAVGGKGNSKEMGFEVRQRLAVGKLAVLAPSSTALLAKDSETAQALSAATTAAAASIADINNPDRAELRKTYDDLIKNKTIKAGVKLSDGTTDAASLQQLADDLGNKLEKRSAIGVIQFGSLDNAKAIIKKMQDSSQ